METATAWNNQELEVFGSARRLEEQEMEPPRNERTRLHALALQLLREVQSLEEDHDREDNATRSPDGGLDFYAEVRRFELDLIKRALRQTAGHQGRAAALLNLKVSTLNAKIKHYNLRAMGFANGHSLVKQRESHQDPFEASR